MACGRCASAPEARLRRLRHLNVPVLTNTHVEAIGASPDGRLAVGMQDGFMLVNRAHRCGRGGDVGAERSAIDVAGARWPAS